MAPIVADFVIDRAGHVGHRASLRLSGRWLLDPNGIRVTDRDDARGAWHEALTADRPVVLEAIVDPDVPPVTPPVAFEQAAAMTKALLKGEPDAAGVSARGCARSRRPSSGARRER